MKILECGHLERGNYWNYAKVWNEFDEGCMTCRHDILEQNLYYRNCSTHHVVYGTVLLTSKRLLYGGPVGRGYEQRFESKNEYEQRSENKIAYGP